MALEPRARGRRPVNGIRVVSGTLNVGLPNSGMPYATCLIPPGIEFMSWLGLAMAPGTPRPIVDRLNREVRDALKLPDVQQRLVEGGNIATPSTPEEMRARIASEMARWARVIDAAGLKTE